MFIAVKQEYSMTHRGFFNRISEKIRPRFKVEYRGKGRAEFALVTICDRAGWRELKRICGKSMAKIVTAEPVDEQYTIRFLPSIFLRTVLFNTAQRLLCSLQKPELWLDVDVVDVHGVCSAFIEQIISRCRRLNILTCKPERYAITIQRLLWEYGAVVTVSGASADNINGNLCLMADGELDTDSVAIRSTGISETKRDFVLLEPEIPDWAENLIPQGFSPRDILGAMYELGREELCGTLCAGLISNCSNIIIWETAQEMMTELLESGNFLK